VNFQRKPHTRVSDSQTVIDGKIGFTGGPLTEKMLELFTLPLEEEF
jgi:hypothetical protein